MATPTILYSPSTLLHHSVELVGHKLIAAHECADRVKRILKALAENGYAVTECDLTAEETSSLLVPSNIHAKPYVMHLETIFDRFLKSRIVEEDDCILPECFPHRALLEAVPYPTSDTTSADEGGMGNLKLPSDPYAHLGYYSFDMSTGMSKDTFKSAMASTALAIKAMKIITDDGFPPSGVVFALTRPPGHHACHALAGGYCYINNVAVAAEHLLSKLTNPPTGSQSRVVILDLDFHHGNGTQSIFYNRREPAYISIHGEGEYPYYTGSVSEVGNGEGKGFNRNFPLLARPRSNRSDYFSTLEEALDIIRQKWNPEYLLVSMGFDTFRKDVLGGFELAVDDYKEIGSRIRMLGLPVAVILEGGYEEELGHLAVSFLNGLTGKEV